MQIPFVGGSNVARSQSASAQRTVNLYLEMNDASPRAPLALYGMPGLVTQYTFSTESVRGVVEMGGRTYWVAGNTVYCVNRAGAVTTLGTIATTHGDVGIAQNGRQVAIVDGVAGWIATSAALTLIADEDFPNGVKRVTSQDGYFIFAGDGSGRFYINQTPRNGEVYTGADFAEAEGSPDIAVTLISNNRVLWVLGTESIEFYENTGNPDFPFERSAFVEQGCAAAASVAVMDNAVYWLGRSRNGQGIVFKGDGITPRRISNHSLETTIAGYSRIDDARAFCFQINGHSFYVLTFPSEDHTWAYDESTGLWVEWLWRDPEDNTLHRHRANCCVFTNGQHLVGDWAAGKVYALDQAAYTDDGAPIERMRITQYPDFAGPLHYANLELNMETGVGAVGTDPKVMVSYWDDRAQRWSNEREKSIGSAGERGRRVRFAGSLGSGRNRIWRVRCTDPVKFALFGATVDATKGK